MQQFIAGNRSMTPSVKSESTGGHQSRTSAKRNAAMNNSKSSADIKLEDESEMKIWSLQSMHVLLR